MLPLEPFEPLEPLEPLPLLATRTSHTTTSSVRATLSSPPSPSPPSPEPDPDPDPALDPFRPSRSARRNDINELKSNAPENVPESARYPWSDAAAALLTSSASVASENGDALA